MAYGLERGQQSRRRNTRQRSDVLGALIAQGEFVSAQALHSRMAAAGSEVGLTTVYRALTALADSGRADSIREDNGTRLFRHRPGPQHRHYLVCRSCGRSQPLDTHVVEEWAERLAETTGYSGLRHILEVDGICGPCGPPRPIDSSSDDAAYSRIALVRGQLAAGWG